MIKLAIHSVPRSGSTWLGNIFNSHPKVAFRYQPLFSYAFKDALTTKSSKDEINSFFERIKNSQDDFLNQREGISKGIIPQFKKEANPQFVVYKEVRYHHLLINLLKTDADLKIIGLIRNPLATLHSWLNAPKEFRGDQGWKVKEEWRFAPKKNLDKPEEFNGYEKWKETALLFEGLKERFPDRFYLLNYNDLLQDTQAFVKDLFQFAGLDQPQQTNEFLEASRSRSVKDAYGVFKTKEGDDKWKTELPRQIIDHIQEDLQGTSLQKYLD